MPRSVRFHPQAAQEAAAASDWYRERSQQAAIGFMAELDLAIQRVTELPETWPRYEAGTRRYVFSVCPYSLVYRVNRAGDHDRRLVSREEKARLLDEARIALVRSPSNKLRILVACNNDGCS